jgi:hypothetical protein
MHYIIERMRERSTWLGFIGILTGFGVTLDPALVDVIVAAGASLAGLVAALTPDN